MSPIHLGFIGLSSQGWASMTLALPLFEPTLSSKYHLVPASTSNPDSAAANPDVDMVAVSIRTMSHKDAALQVIEASGKYLFLEWPVGKNAKETEELYEAVKKKGVKTMIGTQFCQTPFAKKCVTGKDSTSPPPINRPWITAIHTRSRVFVSLVSMTPKTMLAGHIILQLSSKATSFGHSSSQSQACLPYSLRNSFQS
ncbi:hypothetical protein D9758_015163 [Tetrapyrgos nigripes]|uniref:Gfo/Idh/MocA-like oxidoreductase N-terminal domain-containing protein n=1 Tax=Tetrapyrgos nigripes TaxID=182062 RepID=A0A8H5FR03_9AGAR|nr:hypothetical protein D9758_015163 [Tetrapyrgos nigripes]